MCFVEDKFVLAASGVTAGFLQVCRVWTGGGLGGRLNDVWLLTAIFMHTCAAEGSLTHTHT